MAPKPKPTVTVTAEQLRMWADEWEATVCLAQDGAKRHLLDPDREAIAEMRRIAQ